MPSDRLACKLRVRGLKVSRLIKLFPKSDGFMPFLYLRAVFLARKVDGQFLGAAPALLFILKRCIKIRKYEKNPAACLDNLGPGGYT